MRWRAQGGLVLAALFFGVTFPLVHDSLQDIEPFAYVTLRFVTAVVVLSPFALRIARRDGTDIRALLRVGLIAGVLLAGGYATQTIGLKTATPSASAFITGLYVVITPVIESVVRRVTLQWPVWAGAGVATVGLFLLTGADLSGFGAGELWTLACAVLFAIWIVYQGGQANRFHPVPFITVQMVVVAAVCAPATAVQGVGHLTELAWTSVLFTGIACSAFALSLQLWSQRRISPSRAALILLSEPVFAGIAGYVNGERLTAIELFGAAVILVGITLAEVGSLRRSRAQRLQAELGAVR